MPIKITTEEKQMVVAYLNEEKLSAIADNLGHYHRNTIIYRLKKLRQRFQMRTNLELALFLRDNHLLD